MGGVYIAKNGFLAVFRFSAKRKNGRFSVIRTRTARTLIIGHFFGYTDDPTKFRPIRTKIKGTSLHGWHMPKMAIFRPGGHEKGHNSGTKSWKMLPNVPKWPQRRGLQTVHWRKSRCHIKKRIFGPKYCIFGPKNLFFSTLRPHNSFFWPLTNPTQWDHICPMSSGNSGYLRFSCRCPLGRSAGRFLAPIAQNGPFWV